MKTSISVDISSMEEKTMIHIVKRLKYHQDVMYYLRVFQLVG